MVCSFCAFSSCSNAIAAVITASSASFCAFSGAGVESVAAGTMIGAGDCAIVPNAANNAATLRTKNLRRIIAPRGWQKSALFEPFPQLRRVFRQFWHGLLRSPLAEHEPFYQAPPFAAVFHRFVVPALEPKRSWRQVRSQQSKNPGS